MRVAVLDHATTQIALPRELGRKEANGAYHGEIIPPGEGCQPSIDATEKLPGEGFKRPWSSLIKLDENVKARVERPFVSQ